MLLRISRLANLESLSTEQALIISVGACFHNHFYENTRESLRRDVIAPMVQAGILEHNPDQPDLPSNHPRNHYAIHASVLEIIKQLVENPAT